MTGIPPAEPNPFAAPAGPVARGAGFAPIADAELIRRSYLAHESSVRSLGLLGYLAAILALGLAIVFADELLGRTPLTFRVLPPWWGMAEGGFLILWLMGLAVTSVVLGLGLRRLAPWARWATVAAAGLAFLSYLGRYVLAFALRTSFIGRPGQIVGNTLGLIASGYVLLVLLARPSGRVFGREYRAVVRQTPEIRPYLSLAARVVGGCVALIVAILMALGVARAWRF